MLTMLVRSPGQRLPVRPWVLATVLAATVLVVYGAYLGVRYRAAVVANAAASQEVRRIQAHLGSARPDKAGLDQAAQEAARALQEATDAFGDVPTEELMGLIAAAARDVGLKVVSISVGDPLPTTKAGLRFAIVPVELVVQGPVTQVTRLYDAVQGLMAGTRVTLLRASNPGADATSVVRMTFSMAPTPADGAR